MKVEEIKVSYVRFKMNKLVAKVHIIKDDGLIQFAIRFSIPTKNNYENGIIKIGYINDGEVQIEKKFIEHPPYRFYREYLLVDGKLDTFYEKLEDAIIKASDDDEISKESFSRASEKKENIYFHYFRKANMSFEMKEKVEKMLGSKIVSYCEMNNLTAVFTADVGKAKNINIHDLELIKTLR